MNLERKTRLYISGRINGDPEAAEKFADAEQELEEHDYDALNPFNIDPHHPECFDDTHWDCHMRADISMMALCDGVALLDDWDISRGARTEHAIAVMLGIPTYPIEIWLHAAHEDCAE